MLKNEMLENVFQLLARVYPTEMASRLDMEVWNNEVSMLESRLILAFTLQKKWLEGPRFPSFSRFESENSVMTLGDLRQAGVFIERFIMETVSSPNEKEELFPFREVLSRLLLFKSSITQDPALRVFYKNCGEMISSKDEFETPNISILPSNPKRKSVWYKNYGFYCSILKVAQFDGGELPSLKFKTDWVDDDEGVMIMLFAYLFNTNKTHQISPLLKVSRERVEVSHPTMRGLNLSFKAALNR